MPGTTLVVAGGELPDPPALAALPTFDACIAADSGADFCVAQGWKVDVLIGDLDSISDSALAAMRSTEVEIVEYPTAKNETDLELALGRAVQLRSQRTIVVGIGGGRLDHFLGNVSVIAGWPGGAIEAWVGSSRMTVCRDVIEVNGRPGELVSLLPAFGSVEGVVTSGLLFGLNGETLAAGAARGVSNQLVGERAEIRIASGTLLVVQPEILGVTRDGR